VQIAIGSIFRSSMGHIDRYAAQVEALRQAMPEATIRPVLVEGDSRDNTWERLNELFPGCVTKREHGGPVFGSVDSVQRYRQFSFCYEGVLERLVPEDTVFVYVEGDLLWDSATLMGLMADLERPEVDMVAPLCWYQGRHYDIWAVRSLEGEHFGFFPPFHRSMLEDSASGLYPLSSAGSCIVMRGEVARRAHFTPADGCIVSFCHSARHLGYRVWLDPALKVHHPE
jgi:hypothetical protein